MNLHDSGIEVHMLTGDNESSARSIASQAGIDSYIAEALPQSKHDFIKELQKPYPAVLGGHAEMVSAPFGPSLEHMKAGRLRAS
jgi:cation transport ATPase